jgi:diguanylate cyclase (GGDEF)-like protein
VVFGVALAALMAVAWFAYQEIGRMVEASQHVAQTHEAIAELDRLLAVAVDAETGTRGYVLTGDEQHLAPYHVAVTSLDERLDRLGQLVTAPTTRQELFEPLARRVRDALNLLRETVEARGRLGAEGAWRVLQTAKGKERMDALRRTIAAARTAEQDVLRRRTAEQRQSVQSVTLSLAGAVALAFALVALAGTVLRRDMVRRRRADEALQRASAKLSGWAGTLEQRGREIALLGEMGDLLQTCKQPVEAYGVVAQFAPQLCPGAAGMLATVTPDSGLETVAAWGGLEHGRQFPAGACWAVRRERVHAVEDPELGTICPHVSPGLTTGYVCVPLLAQGEALGVLHVQDSPDDVAPTVPKHVREARRQLVVNMGHHVALALANLRLQESLRQQAIRDPLTELFNRRYMEESLGREVRRATRRQSTVGIIMLDIDHFKRFNDSYGHEAGDALLRGVGSFLKTHVRGEDIACRYGGEEFTLILPGAPLEVSAQRAEQLRKGIEELRVIHQGQPLPTVTLSLGAAVFPEHGATGDAVIRAADVALYRAKQDGRNRVVIAA